MACMRAWTLLLVHLATSQLQLSPSAAALPLPEGTLHHAGCLILGSPCDSDTACCSGNCMLVLFLPRICIPEALATALAQPTVAVALAKNMHIDMEAARKVKGTLHDAGCLSFGSPCDSDTACCSGNCMLVPFLPRICIPEAVATAIAEPTAIVALAKDMHIDMEAARKAEGTLHDVDCLILGSACDSDTACCSDNCMLVPFLPRICIPEVVATALAQPTTRMALAKDMHIDMEMARKGASGKAEDTLQDGCFILGFPCDSDIACCSGNCMLVPFLPRICIPDAIATALAQPTVAMAVAKDMYIDMEAARKGVSKVV